MMKFYTERHPYGRRLGLHMAKELPNGKVAAVTAITYTALSEAEISPPPVINLTDDEAQMLMDSLWSVGLRPSEGSGSAGAMLATQNHLADMRKLAAKWHDVSLKDC